MRFVKLGSQRHFFPTFCVAFESQSHSVTLLQHFIVQFFCACSVWTCGRGHFTGKNITMYFFSLSLCMERGAQKYLLLILHMQAMQFATLMLYYYLIFGMVRLKTGISLNYQQTVNLCLVSSCCMWISVKARHSFNIKSKVTFFWYFLGALVKNSFYKINLAINWHGSDFKWHTNKSFV